MRPSSALSSVIAALAGVAVGGIAVWFLTRNVTAPQLVDDAAALMTTEQRQYLETYHSFLVDDHDIARKPGCDVVIVVQ